MNSAIEQMLKSSISDFIIYKIFMSIPVSIIINLV